MLDRNEIRKIDAKVVSEISWKIANFMRGMAPADPQLNFVLVYLAYVAVTNEIDNIDDLLGIHFAHAISTDSHKAQPVGMGVIAIESYYRSPVTYRIIYERSHGT